MYFTFNDFLGRENDVFLFSFSYIKFPDTSMRIDFQKQNKLLFSMDQHVN